MQRELSAKPTEGLTGGIDIPEPFNPQTSAVRFPGGSVISLKSPEMNSVDFKLLPHGKRLDAPLGADANRYAGLARGPHIFASSRSLAPG